MALEYREERNAKAERLIENLLKDAPSYVRDFYEHMHNGKREITTQESYIRDVIDFIKYEKATLSQFETVKLKGIPISLFDELKLQDMNEYRAFLKNVQHIGNASAKKRFSAISAFYQFLNINEHTSNNPMLNFEFPAVNKRRIIKLDSSLSNKLLNGILANDRYLVESDSGDRIIAINDEVKIRREKTVLRNYAIVCLFLGSGLRVSELVGLDMDDINFRQNSLTVITKGGDETAVFFGEEVEKALRDYLYGLPLPSDLIEKYQYSHSEVVDWCKNHLSDINFVRKLEEEFEVDETFKRDMIRLRSSLLRQGRSALGPRKGCNAVFISSRGTRMSVRSVELMIKEMVKTYLPEYDDKDRFSPHKLRATCATRILTQTGDIQLASTQLNHKGIAVTAAFYAELQKEQQKEKVKSLDMNKW